MASRSEQGSDPLISVVVLNFRRRADLIRTLESIRAQTYEPREVIVVDNASGDGTPEFVAENFPEMRLLALEENTGCAGRNRGAEAARGEWVVMLDNDVSFDSPLELEKVARAFRERSEASVLAFKILNHFTGRLHLRDWCHPRSFLEFSDTEFETCYFSEGMCAMRRDDFLRVGGYFEPFRIGGEGGDLCLRMLDAGLRFFYRPEIRVRHAMAPETRSFRQPYYFYARNHVWSAFKNCGGWRRWRELAYSMALLTFFSVRSRNVRDFLRGVRDGLEGLHHIPRTPISEQGWRRLAELRSHRPGWLTRLKTHWAQPEI